MIVVHHAGKNGEQRGISNREDLLDTSISLRRPADYSPAEGARFEVHVAKGRAPARRAGAAVRGRAHGR